MDVGPEVLAAQSQTHAAWVQAVGALVALFVTIWLNRADARERTVERDARARNAGILIRPLFVAFREELAQALKEIDRGDSLYSVGPFDEEGPNEGLAGIWTPPPKLTDQLGALAELGTAAKLAQAAYRAMQDLHKAFIRHYIDEIGECSYDDPKVNAESIMETRYCLAAVERAIDAIDRLYD